MGRRDESRAKSPHKKSTYLFLFLATISPYHFETEVTNLGGIISWLPDKCVVGSDSLYFWSIQRNFNLRFYQVFGHIGVPLFHWLLFKKVTNVSASHRHQAFGGQSVTPPPLTQLLGFLTPVTLQRKV